MTKEKRATRLLYMHTINGSPAQYFPDTGYICFTRQVRRLETSLNDIRKQQAAVKAQDIEDGADFQYGYVTVRMPA